MFFNVFQVLALTALAAVQANESEKDCASPLFFRCGHLIDSSKLSGKMPVNEGELNSLCDTMMPFWTCYYNFTLKCRSHMENKQFEYIMAQYQVTKKQCDKNDELRKRYLDNAKCISIHTISSSLTCAPFQQIGEQEQCKSRKNFYPCLYAEIEKHCLKDAADVMKDLLGPTEKLLDFSNLSCSEVVRSALHMMPYLAKSVKLF